MYVLYFISVPHLYLFECSYALSVGLLLAEMMHIVLDSLKLLNKRFQLLGGFCSFHVSSQRVRFAITPTRTIAYIHRVGRAHFSVSD